MLVNLLYISITLLPWLIIFIWFFKRKHNTIVAFIFESLLIIEVLVILYFIGSWSLINYLLKYINVILIFILLIFMIINTKKYSLYFSLLKKDIIKYFIKFVLIIFFLFFIITIFKSFFITSPSINLAFPLKNGFYCTIQGGNSYISNIFHRQQKGLSYALDFVKLGKSGCRSINILSTKPSDYFIFNDTVYSPCDGIIVKTSDSIHDNAVYTVNNQYTSGNYIILLKDNIKICLVHFKKNKVFVQTGDNVFTGQPLGLVGNSGNSYEPHLHIHALKGGNPTYILDGEAVPITFNGKFLTINSLIISNKNRLNYFLF